ncbi:hypothetical protein Dsin_024219 [Dipteronia sinensis]|uniref:Uncharacterized protein n=1 Tax=Dipteronia sinensis TaxID=43782 RepID=A0AAD9ZTS4_9ROSI|nr:hypothetical protein Dsin_024219 [Dipteronia sinensis]
MIANEQLSERQALEVAKMLLKERRNFRDITGVVSAIRKFVTTYTNQSSKIKLLS